MVHVLFRYDVKILYGLVGYIRHALVVFIIVDMCGVEGKRRTL